MAESVIKKESMFSGIESISGFPYTPTRSGILSLLIGMGETGGNVTVRIINITDSTTKYVFFLRPVARDNWDAVTLSFPVIKGHTYTLPGDDTENIDYSRSFLTI